MATVYLATDLKHHRRVAIKVLSQELGAMLGVERFQAEIRVTANLQHPNLLPLFDSGEAGGMLFYVMPFVEGESLRARLDRENQLPVDVALRIAGAIASALDYAHRHEVIHRDLKPENILLHDGQPLVADFGIALAVSKAGGSRMTQTGMSLGTPQYMSPEQAMGDRTIDARSDIYSLGALTYEMLAGEPPHVGANTQAIVARVLTEPARGVRESRPSVPENVEGAIARALEKLPADRWATAREFGEALGNAGFTYNSGGISSARRGASMAKVPLWRSTLAKSAALGGACLVIGAALHAWLKPEPTVRASRFVLAVPDSVGLAGMVTAGRLAFSRDGSQLAYVGAAPGGSFAIYLRSMDDPVPKRVLGTDRGTGPIFSPDGKMIAFVADRKLVRVPVEGGTPTVISDSALVATWGDYDVIVYGRNGNLYSTTSDGRNARLVAKPDTGRRGNALMTPSLLPGSKAALISLASRDGPQVAVVNLADGKVTDLGLAGGGAQYDGVGHILFGRTDGTLAAAPFSLQSLKVTGPPTTIVRSLQVLSVTGRTDFSLARDGTIAFVVGTSGTRQLVAVDRRGATRPLSADTRLYAFPRISPDGKRVALQINEPVQPEWDVWVYELAARTFSRLTTNDQGGAPAGWTSDGKRIVYLATDSARNQGGPTSVKSRPWDGSGPPEVVVRHGGGGVTIGPLGTWLVLQAPSTDIKAPRNADLYLAPFDSAPVLRPFVSTPAEEFAPVLSPDGKWLAYVSDESGTVEVYVRAVPGPSGRLQVSNGGGGEPGWGPNGHELFYRTKRSFMVGHLSLGRDATLIRRDSLFEDSFVRGGHRQYDVFPGGQEFVMLRSVAAAAEIGLVINWRALLDRICWRATR